MFEHLPVGKEESFFVAAFECPYFATPWHYHPEFELVQVVESVGKRFVGNTTSDFSHGDISFLGPNLPHLYKNPAAYYEKNEDLKARSIVIHFTRDSIGKDFLSLPQSKRVNQLLEMSARGLDLRGKTKKEINEKMHKIVEANGFQRLILLLEILDILSQSGDLDFISDEYFWRSNLQDADRLNKVFNYILQHFHEDIRLEDLASLVYMTRTSFCRFFLERTKRTFSDYLKEVRLNHSVKLLLEKNHTVAMAANKSGYNNLSNFNRMFKVKFGMSPQKFRQHYFEKN